MAQTLNVEIAEKFAAELYSPYGLNKVVNSILADIALANNEAAKVLPPQMFYQYVAKGFIKANTEKKVSREECVRWTTKYLVKLYS